MIPDDIIIKKDEPAPFFGVLVSEPNYRSYQDSEQTLKLYKAEIEQFAGCEPTSIKTPIIGFLLGSLAVLALKK